VAYKRREKLHIVAVVAVVRNSEGKYLVLKRRGDEIAYPGMYTFPGGKIEGNDTVEGTLIKELEEEAGLRMKPGKILLKDKSFIRPDGQTAKSFSYFCEVEDKQKVQISKDFTDYKWVNIEELRALPHVGIEEELLRAEELVASGFSLFVFLTKSVKEE
jgi:8-oxo-dGTP pyrophosphatase MutT (NUDIX family)